MHLRLQEVEEVGYPWHHEHGLVGMEGSHDLVHCILGSQNWQQESEPGRRVTFPVQLTVQYQLLLTSLYY